jgi:hypothetical protein
MQGEMGGMEKIQLTNEKLIGNGSFGVVVQVRRAARLEAAGHLTGRRGNRAVRSSGSRCSRELARGVDW